MIEASAAAYKKSSFGPAFLFLDKQRRQALAAYYAFCRVADDIADEPDVADRLEELALWKEEIQRVFEKKAQTALGKDLQKIVSAYGMKPDRFLLLLEGMQADVQGRTYATFEELGWYLWRVAGVVGQATLDILGVKGAPAQALARALGFAVQSTNIIRDVHEDAAMGRVYLPQDLLAQFGLTREDVLHNKNPQALSGALAQLAGRSKEFYRQADQIMQTLPARKMLPCRVMGFVYRANLAKIEKTGFVFERPVKLSKAEKALQCIYATCKTNFIN